MTTTTTTTTQRCVVAAFQMMELRALATARQRTMGRIWMRRFRTSLKPVQANVAEGGRQLCPRSRPSSASLDRPAPKIPKILLCMIVVVMRKSHSSPSMAARRPLRESALRSWPFPAHILHLREDVLSVGDGRRCRRAPRGGVPTGPAHPPGYPLFTMLVHGAMRAAAAVVPGWGDGNNNNNNSGGSGGGGRVRAFRAGRPYAAANLLSCGSARRGPLLGLAVEEWNSQSRPGPVASSAGAFAAAGLFAFSPLTWEDSTGAEVFGSTTCWWALLYLTVRVATAAAGGIGWHGGVGWAHAGLVCAGAEPAHEPPGGGAAGGLGAAAARRRLTQSPWRCSAAWRSAASRAWRLRVPRGAGLRRPHRGGAGRPAHRGGFLQHVLRTEYGTFEMLTFGTAKEKGSANGPGAESGLERAAIYFRDAAKQTHGIGANAAVAVLAGAAAGVAAWQPPPGLGEAEGTTAAASMAVMVVTVAVLLAMAMTTRRPQNNNPSLRRRAKEGQGWRRRRGGRGGGAASRRHAQGGLSDDLLHERIGLVLLAAFAFYVVVWNGVFSNLPLGNPMAFAVHSRFWMQPNALLCVAAGDGIALVLRLPAAAGVLFCYQAAMRTASSAEAGREGWCAARVRRRHRRCGGAAEAAGRSRTSGAQVRYGAQVRRGAPGRAATKALLLSHTDLD